MEQSKKIGLGILGAGVLYFLVKNINSGTRLSDYCGEKLDPTFKPELFSLMADQMEAAIWNDQWGIGTEDDGTMEAILSSLNNDDDVLALVCAYGERGPETFIDSIFWGKYDLVESITMYLDDSNKDDVNEVYEQKGIGYRWV